MGTSLYFAAHRAAQLSGSERSAIQALVAEFSVEDQITRYLESGEGPDWESFSWRSSDSDGGGVLAGGIR